MSNNTTQQELPMNWHKFMIYFSLWANAALCVINGIRLLTGSIYGDEVSLVYTYYDGLKTVDTVFGIAYLASAVFAIYTRFQLAGFKEGAPGKLTGLFVLLLVLNIGYPFAVANVTSLPFADVADESIVSQIIASVVLIVICSVYYKKRAHLFVNGSDGSSPTPVPRDRFCPQCGAKADSGDNWCTKCGAKLD